MNYMLMRNGQQYGPYTLADLQRYVAAGSILVSDLVKSEGMDEWVPLSQVIGNIPVPVPAAPQWTAAPVSVYPAPPELHWVIVMVLQIVTCGLFGEVWIIIQAVWLRKVQPSSKGLMWVITSISLFFLSGFMNGVMNARREASGLLLVGVLQLAGLVLWVVGIFSMRNSIEEHFNSAEPIGLRLSGVMTFFFAVIYFQYHFTQIARAKKAQALSLRQSA